MAEREFLWTVTDPRGLSVSLAADAWAHIIERHSQMSPYFDAVRLTVADPDEIYFDAKSTDEKAEGVWVEAYYKRRVIVHERGERILYVSVKFVPQIGGAQGFVQTAVLTERIQRRMVFTWRRSQ